MGGRDQSNNVTLEMRKFASSDAIMVASEWWQGLDLTPPNSTHSPLTVSAHYRKGSLVLSPSFFMNLLVALTQQMLSVQGWVTSSLFSLAFNLHKEGTWSQYLNKILLNSDCWEYSLQISHRFVLLRPEAKPQLAFMLGLMLEESWLKKVTSPWNIEECKFDNQTDVLGVSV